MKYNRCLEARHQRRIIEGESYDPISLSDMESDDDWITERKDAVFPEEMTWMNVNEYFEIQEGESSRKRKRGNKYKI